MAETQSFTDRRRPRLLLVSYACSPYYGSEPGIGWNTAVEASRAFDTWVICEGREFGDDIRRYECEHGPLEGLHFEFVDKPRWEPLVRAVPKIFGYFGYAACQNVWHRRALRRARELHRKWSFDVAQKTTMCTFREPGYSWKLGIPFVWGPIGGAQNFPWRFVFKFGIRTAVFETFRSVSNWIQMRTSLRVRRAARAADVVIASNKTTADEMLRVHGIRPVLSCDVGIHRVPDAGGERSSKPGTLRLLWSGVLEPRKALPILLHALAELHDDVDFRLTILGSGSCEQRWRRLAARLGLSDRISWIGQLPHDAALRQFQEADAFAFTSLRDSSGTVVVEAMAAGLPIVAFDHQGVGDIVDDTCGIKIAVATPSKGVQDWAAAIRRLAHEPELRARMGRNSRQRAEEYLWSNKGHRACKLLFRAIGRHSGYSAEPSSDFNATNGIRLAGITNRKASPLRQGGGNAVLSADSSEAESSKLVLPQPQTSGRP